MSGGIDTATFLVIVSAMGSAIVGLATLLYKTILSKAEVEKRLAAYEQNAPELVSAIREWIALQAGSGESSPPIDSNLPLPPSRTLPKPRARKRPTP